MTATGKAEIEHQAKPLIVVAAVIERRGRWLLAQRPAHKAQGNLWEFPGGKVDAGEALPAALARELQEELALTPVNVGALLKSYHADTGSHTPLQLNFFSVTTRSAPIALEHSALGWFTPGEARELALAPLDRAYVEAACGC